MEIAVTKSDRLSEIDENVCIVHDNTQNVFLGIDKKYETLSIYEKYGTLSLYNNLLNNWQLTNPVIIILDV